MFEFHKDANLVYENLLNEGYIVCKRTNAEVLRLDPALTIPTKVLEKFVGVFQNLL